VALTPVTVPAPGFLGLNKQRAQVPLGPEWAADARNCLIDGAGRIASRKGWSNQTTTAISGTPGIVSLHEYIQDSGTASLIAATAADIFESTDNGATWASVEGSLAVTAGNWQFVNFNSKVLGAQASHPLVVKSGSGNFAAVVASSGTVPVNPIAVLAAFGRIWTISSDGQSISYSGLLNETEWATADGAGSLDLGLLWTKGTDQGVALAAFGSTLVVFGKRHIFLLTDGQGSDRGIDPLTMYVGDTIEGIGIAARDTVQPLGEGDLIFLSQNGIRSMSRTIQEKQTPLNDLTGNSRDFVNALLLAGTIAPSKMKAVCSPENGFYLLSSPDSNRTFCVDVRGALPDGTYRTFDWTGFVPQSCVRRVNGDVLFGFAGIVGKYAGYTDNGDSYRFVYRSGFLDLGENNVTRKEVKTFRIISFSPAEITAVVKWYWDFRRDFFSYDLAFSGDGTGEFGTGLYDIAEYGGIVSQRIDSVPGWGSGQFFSVGVEVEVDGAPFAINSITAYYNIVGLA
jgi:hypothetical protein